MTAQEVFDKIVTHLRTQNKQARGASNSVPGEVCKYRTAEGLSCAVGCLLPPDKYTPELENKRRVELLTEVLPEYLEFDELLGDLQEAHDNGPVEEWSGWFTWIAEKHGLKYTP